MASNTADTREKRSAASLLRATLTNSATPARCREMRIVPAAPDRTNQRLIGEYSTRSTSLHFSSHRPVHGEKRSGRRGAVRDGADGSLSCSGKERRSAVAGDDELLSSAVERECVLVRRLIGEPSPVTVLSAAISLDFSCFTRDFLRFCVEPR